MIGTIKSVISSIISGSFSIVDLWDLFKKFLNSGSGDAIISAVRNVLANPIGIYILIAIGLIELLYGKKFLNFQKFVVCGMAGYVAGVVIVSPIINKLFPLPTIVSGAAIALLAAILSRMIYNIALYGGVGLITYILLSANGIIPIKLPTEGNVLYSAIGAFVVIVIMFIAKKNVDRIATAGVGAVIISVAAKRLFDYTAFLPGKERLIQLAVIVLLTIIGFIFQYRRRKRYYG